MRYVLQDSQEDVPEETFSSKAADIARHPLRTGQRVYENLQGSAGDIASAINIPIKYLSKKITGKEGVEYEGSALSNLLPTSNQVRQQSKKLFGDYLEPKNKSEQFSDDLAESFTQLVSPFGKGKNVPSILRGRNPKSAATASLLANTGGALTEFVTGDKEIGDKVKTGLLFFSAINNPRNAESRIKDMYSDSSKLRARDTRPSHSLEKAVVDLEKELLMGGKSPSKIPSLNKLKEMKGSLKGKKGISIEELEKTKVALNDIKSNLYSVFEKDKAGLSSSKRHLNRISSVVNDELNSYGKINPEYLKLRKAADNAHGTFQQSKKISNWVGKQIGSSPNKKLLLAELGLTVFNPPAAAAVAAGFGALKGGELLYRVSKSPELRKIYGQMIKEAANENAVGFSRALGNLEVKLNESKKEQNSTKDSLKKQRRFVLQNESD